MINKLIEELQQKGIEISFSGGKLRYSGPQENINSEIIEKLKQNKGKLIKYIWPKELSGLMPINTAGTQIPIFIVHGDNSNYILNEHFGEDQPLYGFFHPGSDGEGIPYRSVEKMAETYLRMLLNVAPSGPYFLIGYSFGGVLAYEMAIRLQRDGNKVPFLVLIDSLSPLAKEPYTWQKNLLQTIKINFFRPIRRDLKHKIQYLIDKSYIIRKKTIPAENRARYLRYKYISCLKKYSPRKFDGDILLFRLTQNPSSYKYLGWETLVKNIHLVEIDGKHLDVFIGKDRKDTLSMEIEKYLIDLKNKL